MPKKNIIYLSIIGAAILLTGFFLYKTFAGSSSSEISSQPGAVVSQGSLANVLPLGNKFDVSIVRKLGSQFNVIPNPQLQSEVIGVSISNLIKGPNESSEK